MRRIVAALLLVAAGAQAQQGPVSRSWNQPVEPLRIIGNVYYVGANEVTSFLIATPAGHILLDGGFEETAAQIVANIGKLGFSPRDVRVLLNSHAHFDHAGGLAELKRITHAALYASAGDAPLLMRGGRDDPQFGNSLLFPPVAVDRIVRDGERVTVGNATLTAHITAGHTPGCTTWTLDVSDGRQTRHVVFFCSPSVPEGYKLTGNPKYPDAVADYRRQFVTLRNLPCDVPLGSHGSFFDLDRKRATHEFLDPAGCADFIASMEKRFEAAVAREGR